MTASSDARSHILTASIAKWPKAEVILLTTFRCWLAGYETGDIASWELAWQGLAPTVLFAPLICHPPIKDRRCINPRAGRWAGDSRCDPFT
jgi:hypothetical protein